MQFYAGISTISVPERVSRILSWLTTGMEPLGARAAWEIQTERLFAANHIIAPILGEQLAVILSYSEGGLRLGYAIAPIVLAITVVGKRRGGGTLIGSVALWCVSVGLVAKINGLRDDPATFQTSARVCPGNSGSPVFDLQGHPLGIISSRILEIAGIPTALDATAPVSIAVKAVRIRRLMGLPAMDPESRFADTSPEALYQRMLTRVVLVAGYP